MALNEYNSIVLGTTYVNLREKYFSYYHTKTFKPEDFDQLGMFLEKEGVSPAKYIDFVFGLLDYRKPLSPTKLKNPELIRRFKDNQYT